MCWIADSRIVVFGIALLIACACGCNQAQIDNPDPVVHKETADPNAPESKKPADQAVAANSKEAVATSIPAPVPNVVLPVKAVGVSTVPAKTANQTAKINSESQEEKPVPQTEDPATVAKVVAASNFSEFPLPDDAKNSHISAGMLIYETSLSMDNAIVSVSDELLKRGFVASDPIPTEMASLTLKVEDRPLSIWLMSSLENNMTHVNMYHHRGVDVSIVPRVKASGPVDQRVDRSSYMSPIGVRESQQILRAEN